MTFAEAVPGHVVLRRIGNPPNTLNEAVPGPKLPRPVELFAEGPTDAWALPVPTPTTANAERLRFQIDGAPPGSEPLPRFIRLTLVSGQQAIEVDAPIDLIPQAR